MTLPLNSFGKRYKKFLPARLNDFQSGGRACPPLGKGDRKVVVWFSLKKLYLVESFSLFLFQILEERS
jgi:hypothetical protein